MFAMALPGKPVKTRFHSLRGNAVVARSAKCCLYFFPLY